MMSVFKYDETVHSKSEAVLISIGDHIWSNEVEFCMKMELEFYSSMLILSNASE
jgi:hypothetical protein